MTAFPAVSTVLLTGASGTIGSRLAPLLAARGGELRCLLRPSRTAALPQGARVVRGDVLSGAGLAEALAGVDLAYYLVHSMGGGSRGAFAERDRRAAETFGRAAAAAGVERVIYLGALATGREQHSEHLLSREEVARVLADHVPRLVHVRAAMVLGAGSASFEMLRSLVRRLPVMVCPRWIDMRSQPIAIADVVQALAALADRPEIRGDVELGGPEPLTYREMMHRTAAAMHRPAPLILRVPVLTPRLSAYWVMLVTPVDRGLVGPIVEGLTSETIVRTAPPPGINDAPLDFDAAVRAALRAE